MKEFDRRKFLAAAGSSLAVGAGLARSASARSANAAAPKFLIVLTGSGGASIIDSVLAIRASESSNAETLNTFPENLVTNVPDSPFRAVNFSSNSVGAIPFGVAADQRPFLSKHKNDLMAVTSTGTSVNHAIAQKRSLTGNEAWQGRTLQEIVAAEFGGDCPIPNVHLATGTSFIERGVDNSLPDYAYGETVAAPALFPLGLDGTRGLNAPAKSLVEKARALRNQKLDPSSRFRRVFTRSNRLSRWERLRSERLPALEAQDLITKLMVFPESVFTPLQEFGLAESPAGAQVREKFPNYLLDPLDAQAALTFLLLKYGVSNTVTLGPGFNAVVDAVSLTNPPIAFDYSHQAHRAAQALMWQRLFRVADGLIDLLKAEEYADGESFWDHTMIFVATEFGRTKTRPSGASEFGTSHDLNNGFLVLSPMVNGNSILGGVDPNTALTYGFDLTTGAPDTGRTTEEREVFAGLLHALGVNTEGTGLPDVRAMRRNA